MKNELRKVSTQMCLDRNQNFLIVDGVIDGFIQLNNRYTLSLRNGIMSINYSPLDAPDNIRYINKAKKYLYPDAPPTAQQSISISNYGALTLAAIFNMSSFLWQDATSPNINRTRGVINLLAADKLLDTSSNFKVQYNLKGLYLNGVQLDMFIANKYISYIRNNGFIPKQASDEILIDKHQISGSMQNFSSQKP